MRRREADRKRKIPVSPLDARGCEDLAAIDDATVCHRRSREVDTERARFAITPRDGRIGDDRATVGKATAERADRTLTPVATALAQELPLAIAVAVIVPLLESRRPASCRRY